MNHLRTVCDYIRYAQSRLSAAQVVYGHGTGNAFDEACVLLRHVLQLPYDCDLTTRFWQAALTEQEAKDFIAMLKRRIDERLPAPYLTGEVHVQGLRLLTDTQVIVPRSLLGEVLEHDGLAPWLMQPVSTALDLCTGSGALALQVAFALGCESVDAVDISAAAIDLAQRNVALHHMEGVVHVLTGDLYAPVAGKKYDLIVSNPPYVNADAMAELPAEYLREPTLALAGGSDGMDIVRRIVSGAAQHLAEHGLLVLEIGHEAAYFEAAYPSLAFTYLPVQAGEDLVVLILAQDLQALDVHSLGVQASINTT